MIKDNNFGNGCVPFMGHRSIKNQGVKYNFIIEKVMYIIFILSQRYSLHISLTNAPKCTSDYGSGEQLFSVI